MSMYANLPFSKQKHWMFVKLYAEEYLQVDAPNWIKELEQIINK